MGKIKNKQDRNYDARTKMHQGIIKAKPALASANRAPGSRNTKKV